jgi:hypothetical protein
MTKNIAKITATVLTVSLLLPTVAFARQSKLAGTVSAVDGYSVVFSTAKGISYTADATNSKITRRGKEIPVSNIEVGDKVSIVGVVSGSNMVASTIVHTIVPPKNVQYQGKVIVLKGDTSTLQISAKKTQNIDIIETTVFKINSKPAQRADLTFGATVQVAAILYKTGKITAKSINIIIKILPITVVGTLVAKTDTVLTDTVLTVNTNNDTVYAVDITKAKLVRKNGKKAGLAELNIGDRLQIQGKHVAESTNVTASLVKDLSLTP